MRKHFAVLTLTMFAATAQAADLKVTVISIPDGATITAASKTGPSPAVLIYVLPKKWTECIAVESISAQWLSGAAATTTFTACPKDGKSQTIYVQRPPNIANAELDMHYAGMLHQEAIAKQAVAAQKKAASAAAFKASLDSVKFPPVTPTPVPTVDVSMPPVVNCTSQTVGTVTRTQCQ